MRLSPLPSVSGLLDRARALPDPTPAPPLGTFAARRRSPEGKGARRRMTVNFVNFTPRRLAPLRPVGAGTTSGQSGGAWPPS